MITLPQALAPAFAAALALQHLTELMDSFFNRADPAALKKLKVGIFSLLVAATLVWGYPGLGILDHLHTAAVSTTGDETKAPGIQSSASQPSAPASSPTPKWLDVIISAFIVSAGTDGFNSILKFISYKKEETKAAAEPAGAASLTLPQPMLTQ